MKSFGMDHRKMRNTMILGMLWCLGFGSKFVSCTPWVDDLTRLIIAETLEFRQVKVLTRLNEYENFENPLSDELLIKLMQEIPTMLINFEDDFKLPVNSVPNDKLGSKTPIDTSATLFLMLIESPEGLPTSMTERFLDTVGQMADYHYSPKYLIVSLVQKQSDNIKALLEYAWSKKMLDLTIVELVEPKVARTSILIERSVAVPMIHHLNPFKKEYTAEKWRVDLNDLFPKKVKNLWGYPLTVDKEFMWLLENAVDGKFFHSLGQHFNLSLKGVKLPPHVHSGGPIAQYVDMALSRSSFNVDSWDDTWRTSWINLEGVYFVVPVLSKAETSISADFFIAISLSIGVISVCWIVARWLGMTSYPWQAFNIGRVFFGISISHQPRRTAERILFTSLLAIFAIYSSIIYGAITEVTVHKTDQVPFDTLEDLANSSLVFYGLDNDIQYASHAFTDIPNMSKDRLIELHPALCLMMIEQFKNVSCLASKEGSIPVLHAIDGPRSAATLKLAKPCLATRSMSYLLGKRSPYRSSFDKFIMRLHSAGLIDKIFNEPLRKIESTWNKKVNKKPEIEDTLYKQLIIISIVGYGLSILVFLAEIIYYSIFIYEKPKIRPLLPVASSRKPASKVIVKPRRSMSIPNDKQRPRMAGQTRNSIRVFTREELRVEGCRICN